MCGLFEVFLEKSTFLKKLIKVRLSSRSNKVNKIM